jgi:hypothetical protein
MKRTQIHRSNIKIYQHEKKYWQISTSTKTEKKKNIRNKKQCHANIEFIRREKSSIEKKTKINRPVCELLNKMHIETTSRRWDWNLVGKMRIITREIMKCIFSNWSKNKFITFRFFIWWICKTFIEVFRLTRISLKQDNTQHN